MKIRCTTQFDITHTNVTGHYKPSRIPFADAAGNKITDIESWHRARNQQRNWETLLQLISLRTQVSELTVPVKNNELWSFEFQIDNDQLFEQSSDVLGLLKVDCQAVPMLINLGEHAVSNTLLAIDENIWFDVVSINIQ